MVAQSTHSIASGDPMQFRALGTLALLASAACNSPPINAAFLDLPTLELVALPDTIGGSVQLNLVNTTDRRITLQPPPCSTAIQILTGDTWATVLERAEVCIGLVVELEPDQQFPYLADMPFNTGWLRAELLVVDGGDTYVIRTRAFLVVVD
jgi:hypothetical protein